MSLALIHWDDNVEVDFVYETLEHEITLAILKMSPDSFNAPWDGRVIVRPDVGRVIVELRKMFNNTYLIGKIGEEHSYDRGYYPGGIEISMSGNATFMEEDLQQLWLVSRIGHHVHSNAKKKYGYK